MKPTFVFVAGAWHFSDYFKPVIQDLSAAGYAAVGVSPVSINSDPPVHSFQPDVDAVIDEVIPLLEDGRDVIMVVHSYAGVIATEAVGNITAEGVEYSGNIKRLVYAAAYAPLEGDSVFHLNYETGQTPEPALLGFVDLDVAGNMIPGDAASEAFYHDIPEPDRSKYTALLGKTQPVGTLISPVRHAGWRSVPSTYIYAKQDRVLTLAVQQTMVKRVQKSRGKRHAVRPFSGPLGEFTLDCGHTPFLAKRKELGDILVRIGRES